MGFFGKTIPDIKTDAFIATGFVSSHYGADGSSDKVVWSADIDLTDIDTLVLNGLGDDDGGTNLQIRIEVDGVAQISQTISGVSDRFRGEYDCSAVTGIKRIEAIADFNGNSNAGASMMIGLSAVSS